jgi:hypothetical protein
MIAPEIDRSVFLVERIDSRIGPTGAVPDESAGDLVSDLADAPAQVLQPVGVPVDAGRRSAWFG